MAVVGLCAGCTKPPAPPAPPAPAAFQADVKYAQVGDVKLAYYVRGEGKPLLMINGYISTMSLWDPLLVEELAKGHQLILFDNRGVGLSSDTAANNTTIPQMADDAAGLIKALGLNKPDILGWSMGARIGQQLLIRHPDLVDKAVLAAANPGGSQGVPADKAVEDKLNDPNISDDQKLALLFPPGDGEEALAEEIYSRILAAGKQGSAPDDFTVSKETALRQNRANRPPVPCTGTYASRCYRQKKEAHHTVRLFCKLPRTELGSNYFASFSASSTTCAVNGLAKRMIIATTNT